LKLGFEILIFGLTSLDELGFLQVFQFLVQVCKVLLVRNFNFLLVA
jgi:hypothetical protein